MTDGSEVKVDKGTFVTFYKNAHQIHMKINDKLHIPDVEPDHIAGIFKDYTEKEIADSDKVRSNIALSGGRSKQTGKGVLQKPSMAGGKRKAVAPSPKINTKVSRGSINNKLKENKNDLLLDQSPAVNSKGRKPGANKKKVEEKIENSATHPPPSKRSKKININNSVAAPKQTPAKKGTATKAATKPKSAKKTNKKSTLVDTDSGDDYIAESPPPKPKTTPSRKRVSNSGGECPLCSRTFSRTRDLMEHCSTCEGTSGSGTSGSGGGRGKGGSKTPKPATPKANLSECPICSKKVPSKDLERHARLCAENMFG